MRSWSSDGYVTAQIIQEVINDGSTWVELLDFDSDYTIYGPDGSVTTTGSFDTTAPNRLAASETGYLVSEEFGNDYPRSAYDTVEADAYVDADSTAPDNPLTVSNTTVRKGSFGGVEATGQVTNEGSGNIDTAEVVAIFLDSSGAVLGYASGYVENIQAGAKKGFEVSSEFAEIKLADVAQTLFFASDLEF